MAIVIKKRVSLGFLGEEYKDGYLIFSAVPIAEYAGLIPKFEAEPDKIKTIGFMVAVLKDKFLEGKFPENGKLVDVTKEDIDKFDEATLAECFAYTTGQKTDPKLQGL